MITIEDYVNDKLSKYRLEWTQDVQENTKDLLARVNLLLTFYKSNVDRSFAPVVNSGWRPKSYNSSIKGAPNSKHILGNAVDVKDEGGKLAFYLKENEGLLNTCNLFMEDPASTHGWCHLQRVPFGSFERGETKSRIFKP